MSRLIQVILLLLMIHAAAPLALAADGITEKVIFSDDFAHTDTIADATWTDNLYGRPDEAIAIQTDDQGKYLAVDVRSRTDIFLRTELQLNPKKVYRLDLDARIFGQVEQVQVKLTGSQLVPIDWPLLRAWSPFSVQVRSVSGAARFQIILQGVGSFHIRAFRITELADFDFPELTVPLRWELLQNGNFSLGHLGWTLRYPMRESSPVSTEGQVLSTALEEDAASGKPRIVLAAERSLLTSATLLRLYVGRRYTLSIEGQASEGDLDAFLIRPGMAAVDTEQLRFNFVDGVAVAVIDMNYPRQGLLKSNVQDFALRVRHFGNEPAHITRISLHEEGANEPATLQPQLGVEILEPTRCVTLGQPVVVRVSARDLPDHAQPILTVSNAQGKRVHEVPLVGRLANGNSCDVTVSDLQPGWYHFSVTMLPDESSVISDDLAVLLPMQEGVQRNGFLGAHLGNLNCKDQLQLLSQLGVTQIRVWEYSWNKLQAERNGPFQFPEELIDGYLAAGLAPMLVLGSPPDWASSAPEKVRNTGWREAQKYAPTDLAEWAAYVRAVTTACKGRVNAYEIWNEPNGHFLKRAPNDPRSLESIYADLVRTAYPIIKEIDPTATVVIGACAGHPSFTIRSMQDGNIAAMCDAISYHAYGAAANAHAGASAFSFTQDYLKLWLPQLGRPDLPIIDSESGLKDIADGQQGAADAMVLVKGIIARQAAGFQKYFCYNAMPREYPGQMNFSMFFGFDNQPLVTLPMIATWDRLLGSATFLDQISDVPAGVLAYRFRRTDGQDIIACWNLALGTAVLPSKELPADPRVITVLGNERKQHVNNSEITVDNELVYICSGTMRDALGFTDR